MMFIVNGNEVILERLPGQPFRSAVEQALVKTNGTVRPPSDWELRRNSGELIADWSSRIDGDGPFFLTLNVGHLG